MLLKINSLFEFRGNEKFVKNLQKKYLPYFKNCTKIIDIGCGRGEFLELLRDYGKEAIGLDLSEEMVQICRQKGFVAETDAFSYLTGQPENFDGVFLSHVVEHLVPSDFDRLLKAIQQALRPKGIVVIITPNSINPVVSGHSFWLDPTHQRIYPLALLEKILLDHGLTIIEKGFDRDSKLQISSIEKLLFRLLFGPFAVFQDSFIVMRKDQ